MFSYVYFKLLPTVSITRPDKPMFLFHSLILEDTTLSG